MLLCIKLASVIFLCHIGIALPFQYLRFAHGLDSIALVHGIEPCQPYKIFIDHNAINTLRLLVSICLCDEDVSEPTCTYNLSQANNNYAELNM